MPDAVNAPLQHPASADVPARQATDSARVHPLVAVLVLVAAVIVASLAWVVASPVGASPDEDFHVGAMWCPPPIEDSGCQIGTKDGRKAVIVPQTLAKENVTCYAYDHDNSARCTFAASDDLTAPTLRWDDGNYPWGYYQFAHLFVQHSTNRAVLTLRVFNTLLAITLLGSIIALADSGLRRAIAVALTTAWLPMGFYFIAGMNPSSWAMTGTFAFAAGLLAATRSVGARRVGLIACAVAGAVLACTSRGDSAFFLFVVSVALACAVRPCARLVPEAIVACAASLVGIWVMSGTNASANLATTEASAASPGRRAIFMQNLEAIPSYLAGFVGYRIGPGWNDVSYAGTVSYGALIVVCAVICWALVSLTWRKAVSSFVILGAIVGVPVVIGVQGRFSNVEFYQPRYMLPLFAVFMLMLLAPPVARGASRPKGSAPMRLPTSMVGKAGGIAVAFLWTVTNARALYLVIERYAFGRTSHAQPLDLATRNLSAGNEWWWPGAPLGPMAVWLIGAAAGALANVLTVSLLSRSSTREDESH